LLFRRGALVRYSQNLAGDRVDVDLFDAALASHLDVVRVHQLAFLTLQLDALDGPFRHFRQCGFGGGTFVDLGFRLERIRDVAFVARLRVGAVGADGEHGDDGRNGNRFHTPLQHSWWFNAN